MRRNLYIINGKQDSSPFCRQPFYMVYPPYFYKKILILKILIFYDFPKISTPINPTILKVEHLPTVTETAYSCNLVDEKVNRKSHSSGHSLYVERDLQNSCLFVMLEPLLYILSNSCFMENIQKSLLQTDKKL